MSVPHSLESAPKITVQGEVTQGAPLRHKTQSAGRTVPRIKQDEEKKGHKVYQMCSKAVN